MVASIAQGITAALLGDSTTPTQATANSTPNRARQPASSTASSGSSTTPNRARQPASTTTVAAAAGVAAAPVLETRVGAVMTDYGEVWVDESCSWAEVNGIYGQIYDVDGELWVIDDTQTYLAQVPGVVQCQAYMQTAAAPAELAVDPVWDNTQNTQQAGFDTATIWVDENCEWADVGGYTGYVAVVDGFPYIYSEAGDYMADLPPGVFPQCGY